MKAPAWVTIALILAALVAVGLVCRYDPGPAGAVLRWFGRLVAAAVDGAPAIGSDGPDKPAGGGEGKPPVTVTASGSGVWVPSFDPAPGDSIPVWIGVIQDSAVVVIGPDSIPLALDIHIDGPIYPYRVWIEGAFDGPQVDPAAGISWEPIRALGATAGPGVSVGWSGEWAAPCARVSRQWRTLHAGAEVGWRIQPGTDELHIGISAGFVL